MPGPLRLAIACDAMWKGKSVAMSTSGELALLRGGGGRNWDSAEIVPGPSRLDIACDAV